ncbi:MAG: hypothetical protein ACLRH0_11925 [Blautia wexlerae]
MTVDLTKIEEIVNGTLGRLKSVAIAKMIRQMRRIQKKRIQTYPEKIQKVWTVVLCQRGLLQRIKAKATATPEPTESPVIIIEPEEDS